MAFDNDKNHANKGVPRREQFEDKRQPPEVKAEPLPADYVDKAEEVMRELAKTITTSKIRNLLSFTSDVYNVENLSNEQALRSDSVNKLTMLRIRAVYEYGRDKGVRQFLIKSKLLEYLKDVGTDRAKLINFAHYMEALVAYHRYFGGKEG